VRVVVKSAGHASYSRRWHTSRSIDRKTNLCKLDGRFVEVRLSLRLRRREASDSRRPFDLKHPTNPHTNVRSFHSALK
jgi:hypothetical protein